MKIINHNLENHGENHRVDLHLHSKSQKYNFFLRTFHVGEVLDHYTEKLTEANFNGFIVKMNSQRYQTFRDKGCSCIECGREGTHFRLQRHTSNKLDNDRCHFGLWSDDGVQLTKDHIIPKSIGGSDSIGNYTTMCSLCNNDKSNKCTAEDIKNGEAIKGHIPQPQEITIRKSLENKENKILREYAKELKNDKFKHLKKHRDIVKELGIKLKTNIYILFHEQKELIGDEEQKSVQYCIDYYLSIIKKSEGKISPKHKMLIGLPRKTSSYYIYKFISENKVSS